MTSVRIKLDDITASSNLLVQFLLFNTMHHDRGWFTGLLSLATAVDTEFPENFLFGAATSSYQVEGGWNSSGKGESLWDKWVHNHPDTILDGSTGDVAADSYNKWEQDIDACIKLGLDFYRFSISWPRILPTGFANQVNEDGVKYYNNLINKLREHNIKAMVTLYHWELPQKIQELGGWTNPLIVDWFASYAEVVFSLFADRVSYWITINEPAVICEISYSPVLAPCIDERIFAPYICNKNVLLAHAKAWRIYDDKYKSLYRGRVSLSNHLTWFEPANEDMKESSELAREFLTGRYSHPIYSKSGGWPPKIEKLMARLSKKQGFNSSRLPSFTLKEKKLIRGTYDFYGINYYTTRLVRTPRPGEEPGVWFLTGSPELNIIIEFDPKWETGASSMFAVYPQGIRRQLAWLKQKYGDIEIIVTENGFSNSDSLLNDEKRIEFIHNHLEQILLSINIDKVNVSGYTYWSLIDNFEWMDGYTTKFGLYEIDFNDPELVRIPRNSAKYYASVIKEKTLIDTTFNSTQTQKYERYILKEPLIQNGGHSVIQNGGIILNTIVLIFLIIYL